MLSGRRAFDAPSEAELVTQILQENPPRSWDLRRRAVDRVIRRALAKRRDRAAALAEAMARELRRDSRGRHGGFAVRATF